MYAEGLLFCLLRRREIWGEENWGVTGASMRVFVNIPFWQSSPSYHTVYVCNCWLNFPLVWGKSNVVPLHAMKAYGGGRGIVPLIVNFSTIWSWVVFFTTQSLYCQCLLHRRLGGPIAFLDVLEKRKVTNTCWIAPQYLGHSFHSLVTILTVLAYILL